MRSFLNTVSVILLLCMLPCSGWGGEWDLPKGKIINKVTCKENPGQAYALYLPSYYSPEKKWPVIYGFDAGARGNVPVKLFRQAAEKYGIIVAGSLNSRNGPMKSIIDACSAMWKDTHDRLSIDPKNIYFTGFSGGARVSCYFASQPELGVSGVIACSGGFHSSLKPSKDLRFVFFGTAGTEDFNLEELQHLDIELDRIGMPNRIRIFEGRHAWPPVKLCTEGAEWMLIRSAKKGTFDKDSRVISGLFKARKKEAETLEEKDIFRAYTLYLEIADDFKGVQDIPDIEARIKELAEREDVKAEISKQEEKRKKREEFRKKYHETVRYILRNRNDLEKCKAIVEILKRKARQNEDAEEKKLAVKVLRYIATMYGQGVQLLGQKKYKDAINIMELLRLVYASDKGLLYNLACAHSLNGDKEKALECLKQSIESGYNDINHMEKDKDLDPIRGEEGYKGLIEKLKTWKR